MLSCSFVKHEYFAVKRAIKILDKLEKRCGSYKDMAVAYSYMGDAKSAELFYKKHLEHKRNNPEKLYIMEPEALKRKMEEVWQGYLKESV